MSQLYTPFDVGATIYQTLGVDPEGEIRDAQNRPSASVPAHRWMSCSRTDEMT